MRKVIMILLLLLSATLTLAADMGGQTCPVTGEKMDPKTAINYEYKGNTYTFCCAGCVDQFKKDPAKYIAALPPLSGTVKDGVREITVTAKKYEFSPDPIGVKQGEKVRLKITATDTDHGFGVQEYKIDQKLPIGKEQIVEFTADQAGTFIVKCTVFCGFGHGSMKGRLIVQPPQEKMNMPEHSGMGKSHKM
ncbi:MAG: cupredoxin domain-containing protein [bacterium]|nr:cupredoxin domain-containing protein [bacterium]